MTEIDNQTTAVEDGVTQRRADDQGRRRPRAVRKINTTDAAEQSHQRLAEALERAQRLSIERTTAESALEALTSRLRRGDEGVSVDELRRARDVVERLGYLCAASETGLKDAQRGLLALVPNLADAIAPAIAALLGVEVATSTARPTTKPRALPSAVLVQMKPSHHHAEGYLSGRIVLHFFRTGLHVSADPTKFSGALAAEGVHLESCRESASYELDGVAVDRVELQVKRAWPVDLPTITREPMSWDLDALPHRVAAGARRSLLRHGADGYPVNNPFTNCRVDEIVSDAVERGVRRRIVLCTAFARDDAGQTSATDATKLLIKSAEDLAGEHVDALGRVTNVEVVGTGPGRVTVKVTLECQAVR